MKSDEELLAAVVNNDDKAASYELDARLRPMLLNYLRTFFGEDEATAEDVTQFTLKRMILKADQFRRKDGTLKSWVYVIARNRAYDVLAANATRRKREVSFGLAGGEENDYDFQPLDAGGIDPQQAAINSERAEALLNVLESLAPADRNLMEMYYFQGLKYPEISDVLGCSVNCARVRHFRVLGVLKLLRPELN